MSQRAKVQRKTAARALEFEGEKAFGELADGLGLNVELAGHADHVRESPLIAGEQTDGGAEIDNDHGFEESEGRGEDAAEEQLRPCERNAGATPGEPGQRRNCDEEVDPPGLGDESDGHGKILP
jgi:hypothetical protein